MNIPLIALWLSGISLFISFASFVNSWLTRAHSKREAIYGLRRQAILKAHEVELEWQSVLNNLYHFIYDVKNDKTDPIQKQEVIDYANDLNKTFTESHKNISNIRQKLEKNFTKISEKEAKDYLIMFEGQKISLKASREEMFKRLALIAERVKTVQFVYDK